MKSPFTGCVSITTSLTILPSPALTILMNLDCPLTLTHLKDSRSHDQYTLSLGSSIFHLDKYLLLEPRAVLFPGYASLLDWTSGNPFQPVPRLTLIHWHLVWVCIFRPLTQFIACSVASVKLATSRRTSHSHDLLDFQEISCCLTIHKRNWLLSNIQICVTLTHVTVCSTPDGGSWGLRGIGIGAKSVRLRMMLTLLPCTTLLSVKARDTNSGPFSPPRRYQDLPACNHLQGSWSYHLYCTLI